MVSLRFAAISALWLTAAGLSHAAVTLYATEDNNVNKGGASSVAGSGGSAATVSLKEANDNQTNVRFAYFKFALADLDPLVEGTSAVFSVTTANSPATPFSLRLFALNSGASSGFGWAENTLTWNNRPAPDPDEDDFYLNPTLVTSFSSASHPANTASGTVLNFTLSNWQDFKQSDKSLTLILVATNQTDQAPTLDIHSSEAATQGLRPTLAIVPEPNTLALAAVSALGLLRRRR